jgi:hypothetical protein
MRRSQSSLKSSAVHVAVIIVAFRNPDDVTRCVAALAQSTHTAFEIIIVENGGRDAFAELQRRLPERLAAGQRVRLLLADRNLGYGGGVNVGLAAAPDADAVWVLNPDTEAEPAAMAQSVKRLEAGDCDAVGCAIFLPSGMIQSYGGRWELPFARAVSIGFGRRVTDPVDPEQVEREQNYLNGASMFLSRRFVHEVGPMEEDYFLYREEVEWFLRPAARRMRLGFAPGARVLHHAGTTTGSYDDIRRKPKTPIYLSERNKILLTRECAPALLPLAALAALGLIVIRFSRHRAWVQMGYGLSGWVAGLVGRRGTPPWLASAT